MLQHFRQGECYIFVRVNVTTFLSGWMLRASLLTATKTKNSNSIRLVQEIHHHHRHHHHITVMELGHLLTSSGLTYPEVSSKVYHDSFRPLGRSVSLPWVVYFEAFYLHAVSSFSCIPVICPKLVLFLVSLQFVHLLSNLSLNMPVQRLKVAVLPLDLPCSGPVTHSGEILTTGKSHKKLIANKTRKPSPQWHAFIRRDEHAQLNRRANNESKVVR